MRLDRCQKFNISYCGIIDPGHFNQPLTNRKNHAEDWEIFLHDILSFFPLPKNKTHPVPKQLQSSASIKHVTSQESGQMGERGSSWMRGLCIHLSRLRVWRTEPAVRPWWGSKVKMRGGFKTLKKSVAVYSFLHHSERWVVIKGTRLEYVGLSFLTSEPWCRTKLCVWWFERPRSLGKLNCLVGKWIESLGNRPWIPQKNVIQ